MVFSLEILIIIALALVVVNMLLSVLKLIEEIKLIKGAREKANLEDSYFDAEVLDKELHKEFAMMHAPHCDYDIYRKCPYRNEFDSNLDCKIWTCPAYGDNCDGELRCKGLKQEKDVKRDKSYFSAGFPNKR